MVSSGGVLLSILVVLGIPIYASLNLWYGETKGPFKNWMQVVDWDGDGDLDVLVSHTRWENVSVSWAGIGIWGNREYLRESTGRNVRICECNLYSPENEWRLGIPTRHPAKNEKVELREDYTPPVALDNYSLIVGTPSEFGNSAYVFDLCDPSMLD